MKRLLILLVAVLFAVTAFAGAPAEEEAITEITFLANASVDSWDIAWALNEFAKDYPDVTVTMIGLDITGGSTMTMDALLRAGMAPNLYRDWSGRVGKYLTPDFALPLDDYIRDLDAYYPSYLEAYTIDGQVLGLPSVASGQAMMINLDIMAEIGYEVPDNWTITEFLKMCKIVKNFYGGEKFGTGIYAANQSGDYIWSNWFPAFGAEFFADGDYSRSAIVDTGGEQVHAFFQDLVRNEFIPPHAGALRDYDIFTALGRGEIAALGFYPAWVETYQNVAAEFFNAKGEDYTPFEYKFVSFPSVTGESVPSYISGGATVIRKTGTEADAMAARFLEYLNSATVQTMATAYQMTPNRSDAHILNPDPRVLEVVEVLNAGGVYDVGLTQEWFAAVRPQHFPVLQKVLALAIEPYDSIREYADRVNAVLAEW